MDDIIIITGAHDIPMAQELGATLGPCSTYYFDPTLTDGIARAGLSNASFIDWLGGPDYPSLVQLARSHAIEMERALDHGLRDIATGASFQGWQYLNLHYYFLTYFWYSAMWRGLRERFVGRRVHVVINDNPVNFYWPSFLPALLLLEQLRTWGIAFSAVTYGARPDESGIVMDLGIPGSGRERFDLLTHLPTCLYDVDYFSAEIRASGRTNINIRSKYWDVALDATRHVGLARMAPGQKDSWYGKLNVPDFARRLDACIDELLTPTIATSEFRSRQAKHLSNLYQAQWACLQMLESHFGDARPSKMLLSDHDAGFHGPLIAYADKFGIPVYLLPHAKAIGDMGFQGSNLTALTHPVQGLPIVNGRDQCLLHFYLSYPEILTGSSAMPAPIRTVGLVLSGLALNGVASTDLGSYIDGIKRIAAWCKLNQIELSIRSRPGLPLTELIVAATGADRAGLQSALVMPLQAYATSIDLCLQYDAPSSAEVEFLRAGVPTLNPIPARLSHAEALWSNSQLVPSASVSEILQTLDGFVADINRLHAFRRNQFAEYASLFAKAFALRRFL